MLILESLGGPLIFGPNIIRSFSRLSGQGSGPLGRSLRIFLPSDVWRGWSGRGSQCLLHLIVLLRTRWRLSELDIFFKWLIFYVTSTVPFPRVIRATPLSISWMSDGIVCVHYKLIFWPVFLLSRHCSRGIEQKDKVSPQDLRNGHSRVAAGVLTVDWTTGILHFL